jgi:hypothetical protein
MHCLTVFNACIQMTRDGIYLVFRWHCEKSLKIQQNLYNQMCCILLTYGKHIQNSIILLRGGWLSFGTIKLVLPRIFFNLSACTNPGKWVVISLSKHQTYVSMNYSNDTNNTHGVQASQTMLSTHQIYQFF